MMQPMSAQLGNEGFVALEIIAPDNQRQLGMFLTQSRDQAFGRIDFTVLFVMTITVTHLFDIERPHPMRTRFD